MRPFAVVKTCMICLLILMIGLSGAMLTLNAQYTPPSDGCEPRTADEVLPFMQPEAYTAACNALAVCEELADYSLNGCEYPMIEALMQVCTLDESACTLQSRFYTAALLILEPNLRGMFYTDPAPVAAVMGEALQAFQAGDYQTVRDLYSEVAAAAQHPTNKSPFLDYLIGLMHEQLGDLDAAAEAYRLSIETSRTPLATEHRAQVMSALGYPDAAAAEALMLRTLGDLPAAAALQAAYPPEAIALENWMVYADSQSGASESPTSTVDSTLLPGTPFQIAFLTDGSLLMIGASVTPYYDAPEGFGTTLLLYPPEAGSGADGYIANDYLLAITISVSFDEFEGAKEVGLFKVYYEYVMGFSEQRMWIAPQDIPDPRIGLYPRCENGARWRLSVGETGGAISIFGEDDSRTPYYDAPDGEIVGRFDLDMNSFEVIAGPVCVGSQAWWEVDLQDEAGSPATYWVVEAEAYTEDDEDGLGYNVTD